MSIRTRECYIGIDFGTSGVRCCAIDNQGAVLREARINLPAPGPSPAGQVEQDPRLWWQACLEVLDKLLINNDLLPKAISIDGTSGTLLLCNDTGHPLGYALMYNDSRAAAQAKALSMLAPPHAAVHGASSALAKLCYLSRNPQPEARYALHQADWIVGQLTGCYGISDENNVLKMGYDPVNRCWPEWLNDCPIDMKLLPKVIPVGEPIAPLARVLCERWQLTKPPQVIAGTTDSNAATIACGVKDPGQAATALGSTLVLKVFSDHPVFNANFGVYSHRIGNKWLTGGASNSGGAVLLKYFSVRRLAELSNLIDATQDSGLDYYPLPDRGERFPINDPELPPRLLPRPDNDTLFLHGLLEGIARVEYQGYLKLRELGAPYPSSILTSGGGAANAAWMQIRERLLCVPVNAAKHTEAAYGSALIAAGKVL